MTGEPFIKDPDAVLDWVFDWKVKNWLESTETISSHTIDADTGITIDSDSEADGVVTVWLSGGTAGQDYTVRCEVVTSMGRTDERSIDIKVMER